MKVTELRKLRSDIADRWVANQIAQGNPHNEKDMDVSDGQDEGGMDWHESHEGISYWDTVDNGHLEDAYRILKEKGLALVIEKKEDMQSFGSTVEIPNDVAADYTKRRDEKIESLSSELSLLREENERLKTENAEFEKRINDGLPDHCVNDAEKPTFCSNWGKGVCKRCN